MAVEFQYLENWQMDLKEEEILGEKIHDHQYYISKSRAMREFPGLMKVPEVLDVGAGSNLGCWAQTQPACL